jgi:hypothetical protein
MVSRSLFYHLIFPKKSATFWDHALARLAPQESRDLKLVLFEGTGLIGAPSMCIDRRLRKSLRGRRMLRALGVFGMNGIGLRLPIGLRLRGLPCLYWPLTRLRRGGSSFLAADAE